MKRIYLALLSILFFATSGLAQVQLIPPADGGFENATSLLFNNGWTTFDGTTNNWRVGIVTHSITLGGTKAAYISTTNPTGTNNAYSPTLITSHFYRDIIVPAGATFITLSFEWRGNIETTFDRFLVYTGTTATVFAAGTPATNTTAFPGAVLVFTQTAPSGTPTATTNYIQPTIILPNALAGTTVRLIFTWQNNTSGSFQPPAAIDNVSLTYIPPIPPTITSFTPTIACTGTTPTITITGTDFPGATAVQFNGVNATSFTIVNATTITAVLPAAGVSTGVISVTTPNGTATSSTSLTINPPAPITLNYTSNAPVYCVGTAIADNTPSNGGGPATAYSVSPALPAGLSLDAGTGIISGTPTAATASATYTVTASNSCGSTTKDLIILVTTPPLSVSYGVNPVVYCPNVAITANNPTTTGGVISSYSVSPALPAGLSIDLVTGIISGTATSSAVAADFTVTASNPCGSTSVAVNITISPAGPTALTYTSNTPAYCVGAVIADNTPSNSGGAATAYSVSPALPAGLSLDLVTGIISGTPAVASASAIYTITASNSCGAATKNLDITITTPITSVSYSANPAVYCANIAITANNPTTAGGTASSYSVSPALPAGLTLNLLTGVITGTPTAINGIAAADYTVTALNSCSSVTVAVNITISPAAPTALTYTSNTPAYCVAIAIPNNNPSNTGGAPDAYSVSPALPAGLSLDLSTGIISGTPTVSSASANYTITASNSCGSTTGILTISVTAAPTISYSTNPATYCAGIAILSNNPSNTGGAATSYSVSPALPAGLTLNPGTGIITGTPTTTNGIATATYTITSTNSCGSTTVGVDITISPAAPTALTYTSNAPAAYCVGTAIANNSPSNTGGAPGAYSVSPALPAGLSLDPVTGVISGTPTIASASANYTVTASNSCGSTTGIITISVTATPAITYSSNPATYCAGVAIAPNNPANSGGPATSYSVSPALPAGLTLNPGTGIITGTPTTTNGIAAAVYTVTSTNSCGSTTVGIDITISPAAPTALTYTSNAPAAYCVGTAIANNSPSNTGGAPGAYSVSPALPAGLSLNTTTGVISGTPTIGSAATSYTVTASNSCGATNRVIIITVNTTASISSQPGNQSTCAATAKTFSITATGTSPTYQWQYSPDNASWSNVANGTPVNITYTNGTTNTLTVTPSAAAANGTYYYRCVVSVNSCSVVNSNSATLSVFATPTSAGAGNDQTICTTIASTALTANTPSPGTGTWSVTSGPSALLSQFSNINSPTATFTPAAGAGTYALLWTITYGPCTPSSDFVNIIVNSAPTVSSQPVNQTTCAGTAKTFSVTASGTSPTYQWQYSPNNIAWSNVVNGTPANITYSNATTATLTVTPSAAAASGTYYYRSVVSVNGCSAVNSNSATLTVNINSTIGLSSAPGTDGQTLCQNTAITNITYAIGGGGTGASITSGSLPAGVTGNYNSGVFTITGTPNVAGTFNYTVSTAGPCGQVSKNGTITVNVSPSGAFTETDNSGLFPNDNIICSGASVTFTAPAGYGAYTFKVNGTTVVGPSAVNTYSTTGLTNGQSVTVDVANGCITTFGPKVITVNALPVATLTVTEASGAPNNNIICPNASVTLTATGGTTYSFLVNGSSVVTGPSNTFTTTAIASTSTVSVIVTNLNGCQGASATQTITVNPVPAGSLSASSNTICAGTNVIFTATAGAGNTYNFKVDAISVQNSGVNTYSTSTLTNGQVVSVDVTNANGCIAPFLPQQLITVNVLPIGSLTATENSGTPNDNSICAGATVTFSFNTGYSNYIFKVNNVSQQNGASNSYINTTLASGDVVTVQVTSGSGCIKTFTAAVIIINPSPAGSLIASANPACEGDDVTLTATGGFSNYNFKINGNPAQNGPGNTYSSTSFANGDIITVDVTNSNSCITTFNSITISINPLPTGTLVPVENSGNTPDDGIICTAATVTFTAPAGFTNYDFILNGITILSGASNTYSNSSLVNGDQVEVAVTNAGGCIGLLNLITITVNPLPVVASITGTNIICLNSTTTLSDATAGGVWSSLNTGIATVDVAGVVTGAGAGAATINYTFTNANGCSTTVSANVTVNAPPAVAPITGNFNVCTSTDSQLDDATAGGIWSSGNTGVAIVDATGLVSGIAPGIAIISYTVTDGNGCTAIETANVTVTLLPSVAPITTTAPSFDVCIGGTIPLKDATAGGTWSSSNTLVATINAAGVVTGVSNGTSDINYTITTTCSETVFASQTITVNTPPSATIAYSGPFCTSSAAVSVIQTGTPGGTYSSAGGLTLNSSNGTITPATSTAGTYTVTYTVAASGGCGVYTTTTQVIITTAPSATISYSGGPYCTSSVPVNVTRTGTAGGVYTSTAGLTINSATGTITPATSTNGTYTVTYTIAASGGCAQFTTSTSVIITTAPSATIAYAGGPFCTSSAPVNVTRTGTAGGNYTSAAGLTINGATGTITPGTSTGGVYTVTYTITPSGGCAGFTTTASVTITPGPTAVSGPAILTCANSGAINITAGSGATNQSSVLWSSSGTAGTIINANSLTTATYTPSAADQAAGSITLTLTVNGNGNCTAVTSSKTVTISALPVAPTITPATATFCLGNIQPLSAGTASSTNAPVFSSGSINLAIPDNIATGAASTIVVSGIPAGAVINSISVKFNITHTFDADLKINLKAPNNNVLNLVNSEGGAGQNFINTIISSNGVTSIIGAAAPFTNTYKAGAANNIAGATIVPGNTSNVILFANLFGTPNGNWIFSARDVGIGDVGTINDWTITINYTIAASPQAVIWSPITDLYTDAGATIAYAGQSLATVYAKPATSGTKVYTATSNGASCNSSSNTTLTVNPAPVVTLAADYCIVAGKVRLTASSTPAGATYVWSTGQTGSFIDVDIADDYYVVASIGFGCSTTATIGVAQELVTNGDFTNGNTGFTSDYAYKVDLPGLVPAGQGELYDDTGINGYSIVTNGQNVHTNFWGQDHTANTTGPRNFMIVNGHGTLVIWKETVNVLPNTTYYFSGWAMSVNNSGPFAELRFSVNGTQVGTTTGVLAGHGTSNGAANNWIRFYGTWLSGPATTTALISIVDLQTAAGGNDFGLDDISFATLSTFVSLESLPGTDAQTLCINTAITPVVYSVGSSSSAPVTTGLPPGVTTTFNGELFTISGTPTVAGNYAYTVTSTGSCNPVSATGTITVQSQTINLSSGSSAPTVCINTPVNIGYTLGGTATAATVTGLPTGVTPLVAGTTLAISGTPTIAGIYSYTITTTGTCTPVTVTGTITVQSQTMTLNSGNSIQTVCINAPMSNIQYTIGGTGSGASVSGLPAGVSGNYISGLFIISGTPTAAGTFNYIVTTTGACAAVTATGTITVTPGGSMTLTSGTNSQTVCNNTAITTISYAVNNATSASITSGALPAGVTGGFSGGVFTISGTPTAGGVFNYTITTTGGCAPGTATGTITVQAQTISLTSGVASPSLCANTLMTNIVYTIGGNATSATVSGLPTGVSGSISGNVFTISGTPTGASGLYPYTVTTSGTCGPVTANGTINVLQAPVGGALTSVLICSGSSGAITLSGKIGNIQRWEVSTDGGVTWVTIANTLITQSYTNIIVPTMYRVAVSSSGCNLVYSSVATLNIHNLWTGVTSTDWNTATNWSGNALPSISCPDVYIPGGTPNQPTLGNGPIATINNLHIFPGATLTVNGTGTLQIAGTITNGGTFDASNGTIELNGTSPQNIGVSTFMNNAIKDLVVSNSAGTGITLAGSLDVYRSLTYNVASGKLNTGGFLTLKSTATETAWIGDMTNHTITGDVTVERYIATGTTHAKSWQLLAIPTTGQTIKQSWQEGATATNVSSPSAGSAGNPFAGYGTMLTSDVAGAASQPTPGFDALTTPGPSIKTYNSATDTYIGPANTGIQIYNQKGYFILVRGDRSVFTSAGAAIPTVLRTKGILFTPANPPPSTTVLLNKFESVGNPYASAVDLRNLSLPPGINSTIIVWDPTLGIGSANGLGAFQTLYVNGGNYVNLLPSADYGAAGTTHNNIQSGQAFIIQALPLLGGTLSFTESAKASGSALLFRPQGIAEEKQAQLRTGLYGVNANGSTLLTDGTLIQFNDDYSNSIDAMDALKMRNTSENMAIKTAGKLLVIERKHTITQQDTIFLNLTGVKVQQYQFQFTADNINTGIEGFLEDNYLQSRTPVSLSGSTFVNFNIVNIAGSYAPDRFRIVFAPVVVLPVTFTSVKAYRQDKNINVEWKVENEKDMKQYEVEKSTNGTQFTTIAVKAASANGGRSSIYVIADVNPVEGYNYYRIKSVDINGKTAYTNVVKVLMGSIRQDITIYPNPITDGMIHLQLMNQPEGRYGLRLLNKLGQVILSRQINHVEGSSTEIIKWNYNLAHGMYQLEVTKPDQSVKVINVMY